MLVVSKNLAGLVSTEKICDISLVEEFSLKICLGSMVRRMRERVKQPLVYGKPYKVSEYFMDEELLPGDLELQPGENVLACSADSYNIPNNYFGFIQTKGSLARFFVSVTCNDGQVEPGYKGRVTLEITNHANFPVVLPMSIPIAQMYLMRCSTSVESPYAGKYQGATGPTVAKF